MHWFEHTTFDDSLTLPKKILKDTRIVAHAAHEMHCAIKNVNPEMADVMTKSYSIQGSYTTTIELFGAELDRQINRSNRLCKSTLAATFSGQLND